MVDFARGSRHALSYVEEVTKGTTPGTPSMLEFRKTGDSLFLSKPGFQSNELRSDRQIADFRHGHYQVGGNLDFEFSYGAFDDFLEGALFGSWSTLATDVGITFSIATPTGYGQLKDSAGGLVTLGLEAGDWITISGFTTAANNGDFMVISALAHTCTLHPYSGLTTEAAGDTVTITRNSMLRAGTTEHSYTIERGFTGMTTDQYHIFTGCMLNMNLNMPTDGMVTGSFGVVGMGASTATTSLGTPTAVAANSPFDSFTGALFENLTENTVVTNVTLSVENNLNPKFSIGSQSARGLLDGRCNVTGNMSVFFQNSTMYDKFVNETESEFYITLEDKPSGATHGNKYIIRCPRLKYTGGDLPAQDEDALIISMPFQALYDSTEETALVIAKIPSD